MPSAGWRAFILGLGLLVLIPSVAGLAYAATQNVDAPEFVAVVCLGFACLGAFMIWDMLSSRLILEAHAIAYEHSYSRRRLELSEIEGRCIQSQGKGPAVLVLKTNRPDLKPLKIARIFRTDPVFDTWLSQIPDLDTVAAQENARQAQASLEEILSDARYGQTREQRLARLTHARSLSAVLNGIGFAVAFWAFFYPRPYATSIAAIGILPALAVIVAWASRGLVRLAAMKGEARPNLMQLVTVPCCMLMFRAFLDVHVVSWLDVLPFAAGGAGAVLIVTSLAHRMTQGRGAKLLGIGFFAALYAMGGAILLDVLTDRSPEQLFDVAVLDKHISTGRYTVRDLRVTPWGPWQEPEDISVSAADFDAVGISGLICVRMREGTLAIRWFVLGNCEGYEGDYSTASRAVLKLADAGDPHAQVVMGRFYASGSTVPRDDATAVEWYRRAAAKNDPDGMNSLGYKIDHGEGVASDPAEARGWYEKAAAAGSLAATNNLGLLYLEGRGVPQNFDEARRLFTRAANRGHTASMSNLGYLASGGGGAPKDEKLAAQWYGKAAGAGNVDAQYAMGVRYIRGDGVMRDYVRARLFFRMAMLQRDPRSTFELGLMDDQGWGSPQDPATASKLFEQAADEGLLEATFRLGQNYHLGHGVRQNDANALFYFRKAAEGGFALAQDALAYLLQLGLGTVQDPGQAAMWYERSAKQGYPGAAHNLGEIYAYGRGVPKDFKKALFWLDIAERYYPRGDEHVVSVRLLRQQIVRQVTAADADEVSQSVAAWKPQLEPRPPGFVELPS